jgi:hypothetical protein
LKAVGDAHLIEVSVAGKRQQARVLIFPPEPAYAHFPGGFYDWDLENLSADFPMGRFALLLGEIDESLIRERFNEAIPQEAQRKAKCTDRLCVWDSLLNLVVLKGSIGTNSAIIYQRPAGDYLGPVSNRDFRVAEVSLWPLMPNA